MSLVWFLDDCIIGTLLNSGSITQSNESKVLPVIQYIYKAGFTQIMNSCESMIDA